MAQQLRAFAALVEDLGLFPAPTLGSSQPPLLTPDPGDPTPSGLQSDSHILGIHSHKNRRHLHKQKQHKNKSLTILLKKASRY